MADDTVHVVAQFSVRPDRIDDFVREATRTLVEPTVREPGCIRYELCQDVAEPTRFAMIETWESEAALRTHLSQPALGEAVTALQPLAQGAPTVSRFRPV